MIVVSMIVMISSEVAVEVLWVGETAKKRIAVTAVEAPTGMVVLLDTKVSQHVVFTRQ